MCTDIHVNDFGVVFQATVKDEEDAVVNISGSTSLLLRFKSPDSTLYSKSASISTDGTDGVMEYTAESGLFNVSGQWQVQGYVLLPDGQWSTSVTQFFVQKNLE